MTKPLLSILGFLIAAVLFLAVNVFSGQALRGARVDLTDSRLYTLSDGSRNIARLPAEPVRLTMFYSESLAPQVPMFQSYGNRVKEVLREFARASAGKVILTIINPEPFSDAEDQAVAAGLVGVPVGRSAGGGGGERFYFGLQGVSATDERQNIPFFDPSREQFLEYDLSRMIYLLSDQKKALIGVMSWLPMDGPQPSPFQQQQQQQPPWQILTQMREVFDVRMLPTNTTTIPDDVRVLMIVHPKNVSPFTSYAIDQFVLRGGRALVFVDPQCESDIPPGINPMQAMSIPKGSSLDTLFQAWGVEMVPQSVAADRDNAVKVNIGGQNRPEVADYIVFMNLPKSRFDPSDPITGQLQSLTMGIPGVLRHVEGSATTFTPLIRTSTNSAILDLSAVSGFPDPKKLLADFKSAGKELVLGARVSGPLKTAFPEGKPPVTDPAIKPGDYDQATAEPLKDSKEPANIVVIADADMLTDRFWVQEQRLFGQVSLGYSKIADNGDLVITALDNLGGSSDLSGLRARGRFNRPFDRVNQIQKDAEQQYAAKEQELQQKLRDTESKLNKLQQAQAGADGQPTGAVLLTPEQQKEIDAFRAQMVDTRRELRSVQHQLRKDIEGLGSTLKFVNIGLVPIVVGLGALGLAAYRSGRSRAKSSFPATAPTPEP